MVQKERQAGDGRALQIRLTRQGKKYAGAMAEFPEALAEAVTGLSDAEQQTLLGALMRIIRALHDRGEIPVARICPGCRHFRPLVHRDSRGPHHCDHFGTAFGGADLRLDCADFQAASAGQAESAWKSLFPVV
jgi:hypothetical protein